MRSRNSLPGVGGSLFGVADLPVRRARKSPNSR